MYSEFRLDVELDKNRKITEVSSKYIVKITPPTDLAQSFYEYSKSFYKSAHSIASFLLETDRPNIAQLDSYFFAIAFLYRHSIELILMALAFRRLPDKKDKVQTPKTHRKKDRKVRQPDHDRCILKLREYTLVYNV